MKLFDRENPELPDWLKEEVQLYNYSSDNRKNLYKKLADRFNVPDGDLIPPVCIEYRDGKKYDRWYFIDNYLDEAIPWFATILAKHIDSVSIKEARELLIFCLLDTVGYDEGHLLCDFVMCGLIKHLMNDSQESKELLQMWYSVGKWYA